MLAVAVVFVYRTIQYIQLLHAKAGLLLLINLHIWESSRKRVVYVGICISSLRSTIGHSSDSFKE